MRKKSPNINFAAVLCISHPPCFPPKSPTQSAGAPPEARNRPLEVDQNFDHFLTSFFGRFGVVLGCQVGVILGTFGGQDRPRSVQNASWKPIHIKNVNFHQTLRLPIPQRFWGPQDASQNAPRSAQDGSKRLLKSIFFALENRLKFGLVLDAILVDFGVQNGAKKTWGQDFLGYFLGFKNALHFCLVLGRLQDGPRGSKRPQEAPRSAPRGPQERSRRPLESPRAGQECSKPAQELPSASQDAHKAFPKHLARQPFSEN